MSYRLLLLLLPLTPAILAAGLLHTIIPRGWRLAAVLLVVGAATYLLAVVVQLRRASLFLGFGDCLAVHVVGTGRLLPRGHEPREKLRLTVPVAQKTHRLADLLCSLPADRDVELCLTGFWASYLQADHWRDSLVQLETRVRQHFRSVTLSFVKWQSPFLVVEADSMVGFFVPLEAPGRFGLFFETTKSPIVSSANQSMHEAIFQAATVVNSIADIEQEVHHDEELHG